MKQMGSQVVISSSLAAVVALAVVLLVPVSGAYGPEQRVPMISDWSHHHVLFSQPLTFEKAWRLQAEPRYWMQVLSREARRNGRIDSDPNADSYGVEENSSDFEPRKREPQRIFKRDWGQSLGAGGSTGVPLSGGNGNWWPVFPAKFSFNIHANPDCTKDFVVFPTNVAGVTGGQASVIAYNKLYAGTGTSFCGVMNPSVYWSYDTNFDAAGVATTGTVQTSPVFSKDGSKVAFMETAASGAALLHLLKWNAGDGGAINSATAPTIATVWTADGLAGHCPVTGACMISIALTGALPLADTASSPFYDYQRDAIYVGDDRSKLHKIINAFGISGSTPSEVLTGWPIIVDSTGNVKVTSPALDSISGNIFVEDSSGLLSYVRETFSTVGTCAAGVPPCLGSTSVSSSSVHVVTDPPTVDSSTGKVFVFYGNNGTVSAVIQSDVTLSASVTATLGSGTNHHIHSGAFDNTYLAGDGSVGRLYMCGSSASSTPTIQRIGFTNSGRVPPSPFANPVGTMNSAVDTVKLAVATASAECAPVTELFNANAPAAAQDQIFFGVQTLGSGTNCGSGGCVMSINVTNTPGTLTIANSIAEINGPSGITVDNDANTTTFPQASSLYFSNQGNSTAGVPCGATTGVGCAVKVTQAGLQ
jgi:hypothetical protein